MVSLKGIVKRRLLKLLHIDPNSIGNDVGSELVDGLGHKSYVGGLWESLGSLQFRFMIDQGLEPHHVLVDVACGSLRGGVRFIPYLERGNYLGIDIKQELIDAGIEKELGRTLYNLKRPEFVVSESFEFSRFSKRPDFALAHAVFIHLPEHDIVTCMNNLRRAAKTKTKLYATFLEGREPRNSPLKSHPHVIFHHTREQMIEFGRVSGWTARYIGDWGHPRRQIMVEYCAA